MINKNKSIDEKVINNHYLCLWKMTLEMNKKGLGSSFDIVNPTPYVKICMDCSGYDYECGRYQQKYIKH